MPKKRFEVKFDAWVRIQVFRHFAEHGGAPSRNEIAAALDATGAEVGAAYERLAEGKALVLQPESREVLMAEPFSAVPTTFVVEAGSRSWWGNCVWDALGIPAALGRDATIVTSCADCGESMTLAVEDGRLAGGEGAVHTVVHYLVPTRDWWPDVVFT